MNYIHSVKYISSEQANAPSPNTFDALLEKLDIAPSRFKYIKVYGEAGKSTLSSFLESVMKQSNQPVGRISMPHGACRGAISQNGIAISEADFALAATAVAEAMKSLLIKDAQTPRLSLAELLTAMGLYLFSKQYCPLVILEFPAEPAARLLSSLPESILSIFMPMDMRMAEAAIATLSNKSVEVLSAVQSAEVAKLILDKCAAINIRLTVPLKNSYYRMDYRPGGIRFFYQQKEYTIPMGADFCASNATVAIEAFFGLVRHGVVLPAQALAPALASTAFDAANGDCFRFLSFSPAVCVDNATSPLRFSALLSSLSSLSEHIPGQLILWHPDDYSVDFASITETYPQFSLIRHRSMTKDNLYRQVKNSIKEDFSLDSTLLIVGPRDFTRFVSRIFDGFLPM